MSAYARSLADKLAARHGRDPWVLADVLGVPIIRTKLAGRLTEIYVADPGGAVGLILDNASSPVEARERVAHGLAHHLLHVGNRLHNSLGVAWSGSHEREADEFAACFLVCGDELRQATEELDPMSEWELAERFEVSAELLRRRIVLSRPQPTLTQSVA